MTVDLTDWFKEEQSRLGSVSRLREKLEAARQTINYFRGHEHYTNGKRDPSLDCHACQVIAAYDKVGK